MRKGDVFWFVGLRLDIVDRLRFVFFGVKIFDVYVVVGCGWLMWIIFFIMLCVV